MEQDVITNSAFSDAQNAKVSWGSSIGSIARVVPFIARVVP